LFNGDRGDGVLAKAIEARRGRYPDIALTILKKAFDGVAGKTVGLRIYICPALVHVQYSTIQGSDPYATIAIAQKRSGLIELRGGRRTGRKRISFYFSANELSKSARAGNQKAPVLTFNESIAIEDQGWQARLLRCR
jgi:hypothetical protein